MERRLNLLRKIENDFVLNMTFRATVANIWSENMDSQNVLPAETICQGGHCSPGNRACFSTATSDLQDKHCVRVIISETQLLQNSVTHVPCRDKASLLCLFLPEAKKY